MFRIWINILYLTDHYAQTADFGTRDQGRPAGPKRQNSYFQHELDLIYACCETVP